MAKFRDRDGNEIGAFKASRFQARDPKGFLEANPGAVLASPAAAALAAAEATATRTPVSIEKLHRKAQDALKLNLAEGEPVLAIVQGARQSAMRATDRRVFIFKTGAAAGATFGSKFSSFDYRNISGVQLHTGAMTGSAVLDVAGAAPVGSSYWGNKNNDPWKAQNVLPLARPWDAAKGQIALMRELIADWKSRAQPGHTETTTPPSAPDVLDQIKQLGELRDQGILTSAEFDAKKAELLARL